MTKTLVAYFSATGNTAAVARSLAQAAGADLYEIRPAEQYSSADLNWNDHNSRSTKESHDKSIRPALADHNANVAGYDTILLGFPVWWATYPNVISSFLEDNDFSGKRIILFATSGGSGLGRTATRMRESVAPTATIVEGRVLNGSPSIDTLSSWVRPLLDA